MMKLKGKSVSNHSMLRTREAAAARPLPPRSAGHRPTQCAEGRDRAADGVIETDWLPDPFTMNWQMTRPGTVRFREGASGTAVDSSHVNKLRVSAPVDRRGQKS